jgi:hypothetical protein
MAFVLFIVIPNLNGMLFVSFLWNFTKQSFTVWLNIHPCQLLVMLAKFAVAIQNKGIQASIDTVIQRYCKSLFGSTIVETNPISRNGCTNVARHDAPADFCWEKWHEQKTDTQRISHVRDMSHLNATSKSQASNKQDPFSLQSTNVVRQQ